MVFNKKFRGRLETVPNGTNIVGVIDGFTVHNALALITSAAIFVVGYTIFDKFWLFALFGIISLGIITWLSDSKKDFVDFFKITLAAEEIK